MGTNKEVKEPLADTIDQIYRLLGEVLCIIYNKKAGSFGQSAPSKDDYNRHMIQEIIFGSASHYFLQ
jgi:hypothetical protein